MNIQKIYVASVETRHGVSLHEIDILLSHILRKPKEFIYAHPTHRITKSQLTKFQRLVRRRERDEPIAYLTGHKEFYGLDFMVNKHVLIPRPDTETLIDYVITSCRDAIYRVSTPVILDIGTGSGNIAITLKHELPNASVIASDISAKALAVAKTNSKQNHTSIRFYKGNVLAALPKKYYGKIDWLICNAPYLTKREASKQSLHYEPRVALTPRHYSLSIIKQVIQQSPAFLSPTGRIVLEIGYNQTEPIKKLVRQYFPTAKIKVIRDYAQLDRVVVIC